MWNTHVEEKLVNNTILVLFFKVDVTDRVNNENLAILGHDPLTGGSWRSGRVAGNAGALGLAGLLASNASILLLGLSLLEASLLPVHGLRRAILFIIFLDSGDRSRLKNRDDKTLAPGGLACILDVAAHKLLLAFPAHVKDEVVDRAASHEEDAKDGSAQAGAVAVVVVVGALPEREAVVEEMIVAVALGALEDVDDEGEAGLALTSALDRRGELSLGGGFGIGVLLLLGLELLLHLVGVQCLGLLAVGLGDVVLAGVRADAQDVVEGARGVGLVVDELIADAENLAICGTR